MEAKGQEPKRKTLQEAQKEQEDRLRKERREMEKARRDPELKRFLRAFDEMDEEVQRFEFIKGGPYKLGAPIRPAPLTDFERALVLEIWELKTGYGKDAAEELERKITAPYILACSTLKTYTPKAEELALVAGADVREWYDYLSSVTILGLLSEAIEPKVRQAKTIEEKTFWTEVFLALHQQIGELKAEVHKRKEVKLEKRALERGVGVETPGKPKTRLRDLPDKLEMEGKRVPFRRPPRS